MRPQPNTVAAVDEAATGLPTEPTAQQSPTATVPQTGTTGAPAIPRDKGDRVHYETKTGQRWRVQVAIRDGGFDVFREFWPDISKHILQLSTKNQ